MLISQLINPADLVSLTARQLEVLQSMVLSEMVASPAIRGELEKKVKSAVKAMKAQSLKTPNK